MSATVTGQLATITSLENEAAELNDRLATLNEENAQRDAAIAELEKNVQSREALLLTRDDLINKLKQNIDVSLAGQQPREWIEYINSGEYEKAYARFSKGIDSAFLTMVLSEFRTYYTKQIGLIEIKSLDVVTRGIQETVDNDLVIVAVVDILTPRALELYQARAEERVAAAAAAASGGGRRRGCGRRGRGRGRVR